MWVLMIQGDDQQNCPVSLYHFTLCPPGSFVKTVSVNTNWTRTKMRPCVIFLHLGPNDPLTSTSTMLNLSVNIYLLLPPLPPLLYPSCRRCASSNCSSCSWSSVREWVCAGRTPVCCINCCRLHCRSSLFNSSSSSCLAWDGKRKKHGSARWTKGRFIAKTCHRWLTERWHLVCLSTNQNNGMS